MNRRACLPLPLALVLCCAGIARADLIHLKSGGTISGEVISSGPDKVVVKTPSGKITIPMRMVKKVERQSKERTLLSLARERRKAGAIEAAKRLYRRAAKSKDKKIRKQAEQELRELEGRAKRIERFRKPPRVPWKLPEGITGVVPIDGKNLQEQFDRARAAIDWKDGGRSSLLLKPIFDAKPTDPLLRFLYGRALELSRKPDAARELYLKVLGPRAAYRSRKAVWLGELARRKLAGEKLLNKNPGVGESWSRTEFEAFAIYSTEPVPRWFTDRLHTLFQALLDGLGIRRREVKFSGKALVFLYDDEAAWAKGGGRDAHAERWAAPDGPITILRTYPDRVVLETSFRHELTHAILTDVFRAMPLWAHEGATLWSEGKEERQKQRKLAKRNRARLHPLGPFLKGEVEPGSTGSAQARYFAQASVVFEALVSLRKNSGPKALKFCSILGRKGYDKTLKAFRIKLSDIQAAVDRLLDGT